MAVLAYQEIVDLIANANPSEVASFHPSAKAQARVSELIQQEKGQGLSEEESRELEQYIQLEHVMRLAKAKARKLLSE